MQSKNDVLLLLLLVVPQEALLPQQHPHVCLHCRSHTPVQQAAKVCVQALVSADELVAEGQPWHQAPLLEPEDGAEAATEEDALNCSIRHQALSKAARAAVCKATNRPMSDESGTARLCDVQQLSATGTMFGMVQSSCQVELAVL